MIHSTWQSNALVGLGQRGDFDLDGQVPAGRSHAVADPSDG
ncbi:MULTISPECIES: hypothetical protein [Kribbella]|nr:MULTISPECIES: hypothetical protein [Kribbella]